MGRTTNRTLAALAGIAIAAVVVASVARVRRWPRTVSAEPAFSAPPEEGSFVGSEACGSCHPQERRAFTGSHHDRAMAEPTPRSVLAPFDGEELVRGTRARAERLRFERIGRRYVVTATGPDRGTRRYDVAFTIGVAPLQRLLLRDNRGRHHASTVAWDARPSAQGGRRWYALDSDELSPPGHARTFLEPIRSENVTCAECHSTLLGGRSDSASDALAPRFASVDVGCEACHGPASRHVAWAERRASAPGIENPLHSDHVWRPDPATGSPHPHATRATAEVETCAPCHSLREAIAPSHRAGTPFLDGFRPSLLTAPAYFPDGHMRGEVYEWGSFLQSRMFHAGVACSDCHDPHSATLRASGDALCARCHAGDRFATAEHRARGPRGMGSTCIACHMPSRTYAGIDVRHDHSFRIAGDETPGDETSPTALLEKVGDRSLPAIVRATMLLRLARLSGRELVEAVELAAHDEDDLVRMASAMAAASMPPEQRFTRIAALLGDPRLAVRIEAARALADVPRERLDSARLRTLEAAIEELLASERVDADRPEAWIRMARLEQARGRLDAAESAYREALRRSPELPAVYLSLADLARARGDDATTESHLRQALARAPRDTEALHALGLLRLRQGRPREAVPFLREAADRRPSEPHFAYVYALALDQSGDPRGALARLDSALARSPRDPELLAARRELTSR